MWIEKFEGAFPRVVAVFCFGAVGALLRSFILGYMSVEIWKFPYFTLLINVVGSFMIGIAAAFFIQGQKNIRKFSLRHSNMLRLGMMTGFLGGLTTFSTLTKEVYQIITSGEVGIALIYIVISISLGVLAVFFGKFLVSRFVR